jgi:transposase
MTDTLFPLAPAEVARDDSRSAAAPRVQRPNRAQLEFRPVDLESLLPADHRARIVWEFVEGLDLSALYAEIRAVEGGAGRPAIDPAILMALWLYATLDAVGSARAIERLGEQHDAYRWIAGGVSVNYHTLADFRVEHVEVLDRLLTTSVATLMAEGLVELTRVAQDGIRVRASAGAASFRRRERLETCLAEATAQVEALKQEVHDDPGATARRQEAARHRAARERQERVAKALAQLPEIEAKKRGDDKGHARASTTDADARVMKMADGGFRPAFNGEFATDTGTQVIVGVDATNAGSDLGELVPMVEQLDGRYGQVPAQMLVDGGFASHEAIAKVSAPEIGCTVYAPVPKPKDPTRERYQACPGDSAAVGAWRERMGTAEAQAIYKQRAATAECVNALARNRGLRQFLVRGLPKVKAVLLWFALAHNLMRSVALRSTAAAPA